MVAIKRGGFVRAWRSRLAGHSMAIRIATAGLLAGLGWYLQNLPGEVVSNAPPAVPTVAVLVLQTPLSPGTVLTAKHYADQRLDARFLPPGSLGVDQAERVLGLRARRELKAGQVLTLYDLKSPASPPADGAQIVVPRAQVAGLGVLSGPTQFELFAGAVSIPRATLTPVGESVRIQVSPTHKTQLAKAARGTMLAIQCDVSACQPTPSHPKLQPTRKSSPAKRATSTGLRVSYGDQP